MTLQTDSRKQAIDNAQKLIQAKPTFLDTETTGLERSDEVIEIALVDFDGQVLLDSLIKPSKPIPSSATKINGISNDMVLQAPTWPVFWLRAKPLMTNRMIVAYNADFDLRMMQQSHERYRMPWRESIQMFDLLKLYSQFKGEWDPINRGWKFHSLEKAGRDCGIPLPNAHRSLADTLLARELLLFIANL